MKIFSPLKLQAISFLIWVIAFLSIPATYIKLGDAFFFSVFSLIMFNLLFALGTLAKKNHKKSINLFSKLKKRQLVFFLFCIGFIGVLIRVYQRIFLQKIYFASNLIETRMDLLSSELNSGILGVVSAVFYPFATICLLLGVLWNKELKRIEIIIITVFGLFPIYDSFLTEGRLMIVMIFGMLFITLGFSNYNLFKKGLLVKAGGLKLFKAPRFFLKKRNIIFSVIVVSLFVGFSVKVMNNRLSVFNYRDTLKVWEYYHESNIDNEFLAKVKKSDKLNKNKLIGLYSIKHYFAHSVFEYIRLVGHLENYTGYYYGAYEFYPYLKMLKVVKIDVPSFSDLNNVIYKRGVYTTFWGPFFLDFGVFGFILSFFLGRFCKQKYLNAKNGSEMDILLYSFIGINILASFFVSFLNGGNIYFFNAIIITILFSKIWPNNLVITQKKQ